MMYYCQQKTLLMIIIQLSSSLDKKLYKYKERDKMKLISEEITQTEFLIEETNEKKITRSKPYLFTI